MAGITTGEVISTPAMPLPAITSASPRVEQQMPIEHIGHLELLDHLLVFDRDILLVLIVSEQLVPRRRHVLIGGEHRHQCAERQAVLDDKISTDQKEEKRCQITEHIVEKFDKELSVIHLQSDVVDLAEALKAVGLEE